MTSPSDSPSNPVAPTSLFVPIRDAIGAEPVGAPVAPQFDRVAVALATAAQALLAVVEMLREGTPSTGLPSLPTIVPPVAPALPARVDSLSVVEVVNEFLVAKARAGRSDRYLRQLRVSLSSFAKGRATVPVQAVTVSDVEKWLFNRGWKARTMRGYLADVRTLFNFALRRGYVKSSPAAGVELPESNSGAAPGILTPEMTARVLVHALDAGELDVLRHLALRLFTGVRSAEVHRLREENILADRGYVEIPAVKAKTRRRRLVKIQPVLSSWLACGGVLRPLHPDTVRRVVKAAGVAIPANGTRHSFVSYHLAKWQSAAKTALEAGHTEAMLFGHYRELVTEQAAEVFWSLTPEAARELARAAR